jgi:hypothetical protein
MGGLNQSPISKENITQTSLRKKMKSFMKKLRRRQKEFRQTNVKKYHK